MINANEIIYQLLSSDAALVSAVGTYDDGGVMINKIFAVAPPLREGSKVDLPVISFTKEITADNVKGRHHSPHDTVEVQLYVSSYSPDEADEIARHIRRVLGFYSGGSPVVQSIKFKKQGHEALIEQEGIVWYMIPLVFSMIINY